MLIAPRGKRQGHACDMMTNSYIKFTFPSLQLVLCSYKTFFLGRRSSIKHLKSVVSQQFRASAMMRIKCSHLGPAFPQSITLLLRQFGSLMFCLLVPCGQRPAVGAYLLSHHTFGILCVMRVSM